MIKGPIILLQENSPSLLGVELKSPSGQDRYPHSENERLLGISVGRTPGSIELFISHFLSSGCSSISISLISYFSEPEGIGLGTNYLPKH